MIAFDSGPKLPLGQVLITRNAKAHIPPEDVQPAVARHKSGDWGEMSEEDWQKNDLAAQEGGRVLSVYIASNGVKFWIITEGHRLMTTVLLPEDY
jgi:hypothetical protein